MGRDKSLIEIDGIALVERTAAALLAAGCRDVVAIGPQHLAATVPNVDDHHPDAGPLGGILTALATAASSGADAVLVVACDLPGLDATTLSHLLGAVRSMAQPETTTPEVVMARSAGLEPLCAVWSRACEPVLQRHFDNGERAVRRALVGIAVTEVAVPAAAVRNVNTPDELRSE